MRSSTADDATATVRVWRTGRVAAGICGLLFSAVYLVRRGELPLGSLDAPGPGLYPLVVGIAFALTSFAVVIEALQTRQAGTASFPRGADRSRLILVALTFVAYIALLPIFGFLATTAIFVAFFVHVTGKPAWLRTVLTAAAVTAAAYLIFEGVLDVSLPEPIWG